MLTPVGLSILRSWFPHDFHLQTGRHCPCNDDGWCFDRCSSFLRSICRRPMLEIQLRNGPGRIPSLRALKVVTHEKIPTNPLGSTTGRVRSAPVPGTGRAAPLAGSGNSGDEPWVRRLSRSGLPPISGRDGAPSLREPRFHLAIVVQDPKESRRRALIHAAHPSAQGSSHKARSS